MKLGTHLIDDEYGSEIVGFMRTLKYLLHFLRTLRLTKNTFSNIYTVPKLMTSPKLLLQFTENAYRRQTSLWDYILSCSKDSKNFLIPSMYGCLLVQIIREQAK